MEYNFEFYKYAVCKFKREPIILIRINGGRVNHSIYIVTRSIAVYESLASEMSQMV
jgi:hypothetical protein